MTKASGWRLRVGVFLAIFVLSIAGIAGVAEGALWAAVMVAAILALGTTLGILLTDRIIGRPGFSLITPGDRAFLARIVWSAVGTFLVLLVVAAALDLPSLLFLAAALPIASGPLSWILVARARDDDA